MTSPFETLRPTITVETTKPRRIALNERERVPRPITLRDSWSIDATQTWAFTDGCGSGWHAVVLVAPDGVRRSVARHRPTPDRNVGSEFDGIVLALEEAPAGERVAIVSDFLWNFYYILGWRKVYDPYLVERRARARALLVEKAFAAVTFIYHPGHQKDPSDFSRLNNLADQLCRRAELCDHTEPLGWSTLP